MYCAFSCNCSATLSVLDKTNPTPVGVKTIKLSFIKNKKRKKMYNFPLHVKQPLVRTILDKLLR